MHGLEYINELVMMADGHGIYYVLQDANYNVIALVDGENAAQYSTDYDPYGQMRWRSNAPGSSWIEHEYNPAAPVYNYDLPGFQGGTQDRETGLICFGARCYDPDLGRWLQSDPNGTGLVLNSSLRYQGQAPTIASDMHLPEQYSDGPNPYLFVQANPYIGSDPSGLNSVFLGRDFVGAAIGGADSLLSADQTQMTLWHEDWGDEDDDYVDAIYDHLVMRDDAIDTLYDGLAKAGQGFAQSRSYAKAAMMWLQVYTDYMMPETDRLPIDVDLSGMLNLMELTACFAGGTPVTLADGSQIAIEEIEIGDWVLARPDGSNADAPPAPARVTATSVRSRDQYLVVNIAGDEFLVVTDEHPFWVVEKGWLPASSLTNGTTIATKGGQATVNSIEQCEGSIRVYNLQVESAETFFVGRHEAWVHNNCITQIHHIIPLSLKDHQLIRATGFKMYGQDNRMPLRVTTHKGPHPKYTKQYIKPQLDAIYKNYQTKAERQAEIKKVVQRARNTLQAMEQRGTKINRIRPWKPIRIRRR